MNVRLADAARRDADQHFTADRLGKLKVFDAERPVFLMNDGGGNFHGGTPRLNFRQVIFLCVFAR